MLPMPAPLGAPAAARALRAAIKRIARPVCLAWLLVLVHGAALALDCDRPAANDCYFSFRPGNSNDSNDAHGELHFYSSADPAESRAGGPPIRAVVAMHGHPRDAGRTFDAVRQAASAAGRRDSTLVLAPLFQVADGADRKCQGPGVPAAQAADLLWTCDSWIEGGRAQNGQLTSFAALDELIRYIEATWPTVDTITLAGFSAGAQLVQHYIGFAAERGSPRVKVRYVVADPGTWLYFDELRPTPMVDGRPASWAQCADGQGRCALELVKAPADCPHVNSWKYGLERLPESLQAAAAQAGANYAAADVSYLAGALDDSPAPGTFYGILDKSCAANAQGPYRRQRGQAYVFYENSRPATIRRRTLALVPGCAHDVACVFTSRAGRDSLFAR